MGVRSAQILLFFIINCLPCAFASHHWFVTESGRIEAKLESAFPLRRPNDLLAMLEQEQRVVAVTEMQTGILRYKNSVDKQWASIEGETDFEKRHYAEDKQCIFAEAPLSRFRMYPAFIDVVTPNRPLFGYYTKRPDPPICQNYFKLDFSLLTFPHLKTLSGQNNNFTCGTEHVETDAPINVDIEAMLKRNKTDWTAYNLATLYWQLLGNGSNAVECSRRAIYLAPKEERHIVLLNLGTLLQACRSLGEAAIVLHTAVDLDRSQYRSHISLGHVYTRLADYQRAAGCYENALSLFPTLKQLAMQHAAVLCHQRLIAGLWAIDAALKKIVDELQEYAHLQEQWMLVNTKIGIERFSGAVETPNTLDSIRSIWKAVEQKAFLLTERMSNAEPRQNQEPPPPPPPDLQPSSSPSEITFYTVDAPVGKGKKATIKRNILKAEQLFDCTKEACPQYLTTPAPAIPATVEIKRIAVDEEALKVKVQKLHDVMTSIRNPHDMSPEVLKAVVMETLVRIEGNYVGPQPKDSPYWVTLKYCVSLADSVEFPDECGQQTFAEYALRMNRRGSPMVEIQNEMLDESTIENYEQSMGSNQHRDVDDL